MTSPWSPLLPDWVTEIRPHQYDAANEILEAFDRGAKIVELDAPVGAGKTLIAEMVRLKLPCDEDRLYARGIYTCTTKSLQDQFVRDYTYGAVLKGRANYETELGGRGITAEDCQGKECSWCENACPYKGAVSRFASANVGVTNMSYLLGQINNVPTDRAITTGRDLVVVDECDEIESALVGSAEVVIGTRWQDEWRIPTLKKGVHAKTQVEWLRDGSRRGFEWAKKHNRPGLGVEGLRKLARARSLASKMVEVAHGIEGNADNWVREYDDRDDRVTFKPVLVGKFGRQKLWRHADRFLVMSGTIISGEQWSEDVGVIGVDGYEDLDWEWVSVPMTFDVANRPIFYVPGNDMKSGGGEGKEAWREKVKIIGDQIRLLLDRHPGEAMLVHTVSYALSTAVFQEVSGRRTGRRTDAVLHDKTDDGMNLWSYTGPTARDEAINKYKIHGGVMIGASLDRGIDLPGDLCRVVVIAKVPFPNLGDKRNSARLRMADGNSWYATQVARTIVQMTGRGVRSKDDHATSYILDAQFGKWYRRNAGLLPKWWREALEPTTLDV